MVAEKPILLEIYALADHLTDAAKMLARDSQFFDLVDLGVHPDELSRKLAEDILFYGEIANIVRGKIVIAMARE